ncbi:hypothetical protein A0H81_13810 [Grifola frondosa]|uniref:Uncharacterized protein n=1 Tax=Grifola frondosa TaxID=5627 RepID=A0A1C7LP22_GRIFR|nr:hypothetical protein A0H81_13810 [Grifola frondosa]
MNANRRLLNQHSTTTILVCTLFTIHCWAHRLVSGNILENLKNIYAGQYSSNSRHPCALFGTHLDHEFVGRAIADSKASSFGEGFLSATRNCRKTSEQSSGYYSCEAAGKFLTVWRHNDCISGRLNIIDYNHHRSILEPK